MNEWELRLVAELGTAFYFRAAGPGGPAWLSAGFFAVTGASQPPAGGWDWTEAIHPDDRATFLERWTQAQVAGTRLDTEVRLTRAQGRDRWYRLRATVVACVLDGYVDGGTVLLHDSDCTSAPDCWRSALDALPVLTDALAARSLRVGPLSEHGLARTERRAA